MEDQRSRVGNNWSPNIFDLSIRASPVSNLVVVVPVGWARLELKAHSLSQILVGALIAIPLTWFQLVVYTAVL